MNAADVMVTADNGQYDSHTLAEAMVAALLAHGEQGQGVTIEADGDLHPKDPPMTTRLPDGTLWVLDCFDRASSPDGDNLYRLVPISAEPGDFPDPASEVARLTAENERLFLVLVAAQERTYCCRHDSVYGRADAESCASHLPDQPERWCHWCVITVALAASVEAPLSAETGDTE